MGESVAKKFLSAIVCGVSLDINGMEAHLGEASQMAEKMGRDPSRSVRRIRDRVYSRAVFETYREALTCYYTSFEKNKENISWLLFNDCEKIRHYGEMGKVDVSRQIDHIYDLIAKS